MSTFVTHVSFHLNCLFSIHFGYTNCFRHSNFSARSKAFLKFVQLQRPGSFRFVTIFGRTSVESRSNANVIHLPIPSRPVTSSRFSRFLFRVARALCAFSANKLCITQLDLFQLFFHFLRSTFLACFDLFSLSVRPKRHSTRRFDLWCSMIVTSNRIDQTFSRLGTCAM